MSKLDSRWLEADELSSDDDSVQLSYQPFTASNGKSTTINLSGGKRTEAERPTSRRKPTKRSRLAAGRSPPLLHDETSREELALRNVRHAILPSGITSRSQLVWYRASSEEGCRFYPCRICEPAEARHISLDPDSWDAREVALIQALEYPPTRPFHGNRDRLLVNRTELVPYFGSLRHDNDHWCVTLWKRYTAQRREGSRWNSETARDSDLPAAYTYLQRILKDAEERDYDSEEVLIANHDHAADVGIATQDLEIPYKENLLPEHDDFMDLDEFDAKSSEPLRPGDVVAYSHPLFVAGDPRGRRQSTVLNTDPKRTPILTLENGDALPNDWTVKRVKVWEQRKLFPHPHGFYRPIECFNIIKAGQGGTLAGLQKESRRIGEILDRNLGNFTKRAEEEGFAPMDMFHKYKSTNEVTTVHTPSSDSDSSIQSRPKEISAVHGEASKAVATRIDILSSDSSASSSSDSDSSMQSRPKEKPAAHCVPCKTVPTRVDVLSCDDSDSVATSSSDSDSSTQSTPKEIPAAHYNPSKAVATRVDNLLWAERDSVLSSSSDSDSSMESRPKVKPAVHCEPSKSVPTRVDLLSSDDSDSAASSSSDSDSSTQSRPNVKPAVHCEPSKAVPAYVDVPSCESSSDSDSSIQSRPKEIPTARCIRSKAVATRVDRLSIDDSDSDTSSSSDSHSSTQSRPKEVPTVHCKSRKAVATRIDRLSSDDSDSVAAHSTIVTPADTSKAQIRVGVKTTPLSATSKDNVDGSLLPVNNGHRNVPDAVRIQMLSTIIDAGRSNDENGIDFSRAVESRMDKSSLRARRQSAVPSKLKKRRVQLTSASESVLINSELLRIGRRHTKSESNSNVQTKAGSVFDFSNDDHALAGNVRTRYSSVEHEKISPALQKIKHIREKGVPDSSRRTEYKHNHAVHIRRARVGSSISTDVKQQFQDPSIPGPQDRACPSNNDSSKRAFSVVESSTVLPADRVRRLAPYHKGRLTASTKLRGQRVSENERKVSNSNGNGDKKLPRSTDRKERIRTGAMLGHAGKPQLKETRDCLALSSENGRCHRTSTKTTMTSTLGDGLSFTKRNVRQSHPVPIESRGASSLTRSRNSANSVALMFESDDKRMLGDGSMRSKQSCRNIQEDNDRCRPPWESYANRTHSYPCHGGQPDDIVTDFVDSDERHGESYCNKQRKRLRKSGKIEFGSRKRW